MTFISRRAQIVYSPSRRPQSVEPSPERGSPSRDLTNELSISESSGKAASSDIQESPASRSAEFPTRQMLQTISSDNSSQNFRSSYAPDINQSNGRRIGIDHSTFPEIQSREEFGHHLEEMKDLALNQEPSAKEKGEHTPNQKKDQLQEGYPLNLENETPEDTRSSAESGVDDENAQGDRPKSPISRIKDLGSRAVEKSVLDIFSGLSVGFDLLARFNEQANCCIADTKGGNRCTRHIKQTDVSKIREMLPRLSAPYETQRLYSELLSLVNLIFCGRSHRENVRRLAEKLRRGVSVDNETTTTATTAHTVEKQNKQRPKKSKARPTQSTPQIPHYNLRSKPVHHTNLPQFTSWQPAASQKVSVRDLVAKIMRKPLTRTDERPGWLYVYWNQSNFGYRKIGYTTVATAARLRQWEKQCKHRAEQITQPSECEGLQEDEKLPHVRRLETLVHATLKDDRYCEPCCAACQRCHREWFDVRDPHKIHRVKAFWSEWISREPYEFVKEKGKWMLKAEFKEEVDDVCRRLEELEKKTQQSQPAVRLRPRGNERRGSGRQSPNRRNGRLPELRRSMRLQGMEAESLTISFLNGW